jgi:hypothetical protein
MFHFQRVLKNPQTHAAAFSALNTRDILAQHTCLFEENGRSGMLLREVSI